MKVLLYYVPPVVFVINKVFLDIKMTSLSSDKNEVKLTAEVNF